MASSSASKRSRRVPSYERNASPDISPHKSIELSLFRNEGFIFPEKLSYQGLSTFVQMKGDYYPDLVGVFYNNLKVVNDDIHLRVKGVDILINNDTWVQVARIKDEGCKSHLPDSLHNKWTKKKQMFKDCMRYPGRYKKEKRFLHR
ncbi:hypothetical protein V8G54_036860 [Vigna mungo]|uniref:Uncharacterized protein n=1 Tax=Vigna mungo TaxID=3915 RepID=A0AAQ3REV9_VIGMU